jgi:hypothetical protein
MDNNQENLSRIIKKSIAALNKFYNVNIISYYNGKATANIDDQFVNISLDLENDIGIILFPDKTKIRFRLINEDDLSTELDFIEKKEINVDEIKKGMVLYNHQLSTEFIIRNDEDIQIVKENVLENNFRYFLVSEIAVEKEKEEENIIKQRSDNDIWNKKQISTKNLEKKQKEKDKKNIEISFPLIEKITSDIIDKMNEFLPKSKQKKSVIIYNFSSKSFTSISFNKEFKEMNNGIKKMQIQKIISKLSNDEAIINYKSIF